MSIIQAVAHWEKQRIYETQNTVRLKRFYSNITHWELLLSVYERAGDPEMGITDYVESLKSTRVTRLTIYNFIKDRISDGDFVVIPSVKRSKKSLALSDELKQELECYMMANWQFSQSIQ